MNTLTEFFGRCGDVAEVSILGAQGSVPRDAGTVMYVSQNEVWGTIGGGQLEYMAIDQSRKMLRAGRAMEQMDVPLGPEIGQCCGGRVQIAIQAMDKTARQSALTARASSVVCTPHVLIFGAGHVGRALATALRVLPVQPRLIDSRTAELGLDRSGIAQTLTPLPESEVDAAPSGSAFVVLTHDHALDFMITSQALMRGDAAYVGMIGSSTKRAKFRSFCAQAGGPSTAKLICPIGAGRSASKHPEVIAAMVAAELLGVLMPMRQMESARQ